ncbi:LCP family protein [Patescibacteria group bacterium]|nr:LCP family protein [Patescibacteria group bacterium]
MNFLVGGKNGMMMDTIILVHVDSEEREIRMVSLPRDLYYNGRKINSYHALYGMPQLLKELEKISGYKIDKYISIDMYAFIDVVDLIGGIDVHLDEALIDPTYKVIDNGVESTLHYEPGDYHLGGKEALRLARSRHTSSDFARASRQHKILSSLKSAASELGFSNSGTLYEIVRAVLSKTETSISIDEAIKYFFMYRDYKMGKTAVLSTGNILYSPPYVKQSDCEVMEILGESNQACVEERFAYTLLPIDDDWDKIKKFFRDNLQ